MIARYSADVSGPGPHGQFSSGSGGSTDAGASAGGRDGRAAKAGAAPAAATAAPTVSPRSMPPTNAERAGDASSLPDVPPTRWASSDAPPSELRTSRSGTPSALPAFVR